MTTSIQRVGSPSARATGSTSATVGWAAPHDPGVAAVTVTRTDPQGAGRAVYSGPATTFTDTGLVPGVGYSYTVVAQDAAGRQGPVSTPARVTTSRTWTTSVVSPYAGWPGAMACATSTWCLSVNNTGTFQVMSGSTWSAPKGAFKAEAQPRYSPLVDSLTCPSPGRCFAIRGSLVIEYAGGAWRSTGAPSSGWRSLSCPTTTYCLAIRGDGWWAVRNGTTWSALKRMGTLRGVIWTSVSCQAAGRCFAIATGSATYSNWRGTLTTSGWVTGYLGSSADYGSLQSLSCAASSCLALGDRTRVMVSGSTWSIQALPPRQDLDDSSMQVSCGSAGLCVSRNEGNVTRWSATTLLERTKLSAGIGRVASVSCPRDAGVCFAIDDRGRFYRWSSTAHWVLVATTVQTTGGVNRVGCLTTTSCFFVDENGWLVAWNGSTWTRSSKLFTQSAIVECSGSSFCIAVDGSNRAYRVWAKGFWGALKAMPLNATDVSCASPTLCLSADTQGRVSRFNGSSWYAPVTAIADTWGTGPRVSCAPAGPCMITSNDGLYRRYVGTSLTATQRLPQAFPALGALLSCGAPTSCVAVAESGSWAQWNGSTWSSRPVAVDSEMLGSLSCLTATHCIATHGQMNDYGPVTWNSGVWATRFGESYSPDGSPRAPECPTMATCFVAGGTTVSRSS
ncbi:fibronectin type III domain-containing protein [Terrabacter sp. BE26]|uniref:fibronectin type III domain-containing protein n=1 Tax=Terrabacter sp. BE26 TaxID=2898152 RepID=UPI0035BE2838